MNCKLHLSSFCRVERVSCVYISVRIHAFILYLTREDRVVQCNVV
jgi:hypothetical protein